MHESLSTTACDFDEVHLKELFNNNDINNNLNGYLIWLDFGIKMLSILLINVSMLVVYGDGQSHICGGVVRWCYRVLPDIV